MRAVKVKAWKGVLTWDDEERKMSQRWCLTMKLVTYPQSSGSAVCCGHCLDEPAASGCEEY